MTDRGRTALTTTLAVAGLLAVIAAAGLPARQERAPARFASRIQLVEIYATVTGADGQPVTGLHREDFEVYENDRLQEVSTFAGGELPLVVALGVDRSWSMAGEPLRLASQASQAFLRALRPGDRSMVLAIGNDADIVAPLSMDRAGQARAIAALDPWGTTALHDAIIAALDRLDPEAGRQALIVFSDGADRYSRGTAAQVVERARRSHALIYLIAFGRGEFSLLVELAAITGGRSFLLDDVRDLERTLAAVAQELRSQYLLGYEPSDPIDSRNPSWRSIKVVLKKPGLRVRARDGYLGD